MGPLEWVRWNGAFISKIAKFCIEEEERCMAITTAKETKSSDPPVFVVVQNRICR